MDLFRVFLLFLRLGAFTFGGGIVMMGLLQRELKETESFSQEEIADMLVFTTAFPGPIAVNLSYLAGLKLAGKTGAAVAVAGTVLPPFFAILLLAKVLLLYLQEPLVRAFFLGATCAVVIIIGGVVLGMAGNVLRGGWKDVMVFSLASILLLGFGFHPLAVLGLGAPLRLLLGDGGAK